MIRRWIGEPPTPARRLAVSGALALVAGGVALVLHSRAGFWPDFVFPWEGARLLLSGQDPYAVLRGGLPEPFESPLLYPLTTVLAAVPVAALPMAPASAIAMAIATGLLAWGLTAREWQPLWLLASAPFVMAVNLGQWSPLVAAGALVPSLGFLLSLKPNIGLAAFAWRPDRRIALGVALALIVSLAVLPRWPLAWIDAVRGLEGHPVPLLSGGGLGLGLGLALLRWRSAEARLILAMACVPQLLFFADQLPLMLVARTPTERKVASLCSLLAFTAWFLVASQRPAEAYVPAAAPFVLLGVYGPALVIVLRRPNA